jgi:hypothetical protein
MTFALASGFGFSMGVDMLTAGTQPVAYPAVTARSQPSAATPRQPSEAGESPALPAATPAESQAAQAPSEVKTAAGATVLTGDSYTDGQAPADHASIPPAPARPAAQPAAAATPATVDPAGPDPAVAAAEAAGEPAPPTLHPTAAVPHEPVAQAVFTDYQAAMHEAVVDRKMLFIYFHERRPNAAQRAFEKLTLADRQIKEKLQRYVLLRLPRDASIVKDGVRIELLKHAAFAEMLGRQGVAIVDLAHEGADYYGHVVSTFPFTPGKYYRKEALSIILDLPPGTLTQRTMIYAVRIHPEAPASTQGIFHTALADEAKEHASYQASILSQGHHSWESRFHRINAKLPSGVVAQEVVAESWPNEGLVEACVDCVHSWRQSPGHWGAVRGRHPVFGYDIKRGRNGIWYATGIFGRLFGRN